jgi:hypothetical protein
MNALAIHVGPCVCARPDCDREWPRDPILDVPYPDCRAPAGVRCKRPSGHSGTFVTAHAASDLAADAAGAYGPCPLGCCGTAHLTTATRIAASARASGSVQGAFSF